MVILQLSMSLPLFLLKYHLCCMLTSHSATADVVISTIFVHCSDRESFDKSHIYHSFTVSANTYPLHVPLTSSLGFVPSEVCLFSFRAALTTDFPHQPRLMQRAELGGGVVCVLGVHRDFLIQSFSHHLSFDLADKFLTCRGKACFIFMYLFCIKY